MKHMKSDSRTQQAFSSIASQCMCVSTSNREPDAQVSKSTQWLSASQGWWHPCPYPIYSKLVLCSHKATCCHKVHPTLSHFPMTVIQFAFHFTLGYVVYFTIIYELNTVTCSTLLLIRLVSTCSGCWCTQLHSCACWSHLGTFWSACACWILAPASPWWCILVPQLHTDASCGDGVPCWLGW